jgi:hypothetical protein
LVYHKTFLGLLNSELQKSTRYSTLQKQFCTTLYYTIPLFASLLVAAAPLHRCTDAQLAVALPHATLLLFFFYFTLYCTVLYSTCILMK